MTTFFRHLLYWVKVCPLLHLDDYHWWITTHGSGKLTCIICGKDKENEIQ